MRSFANRNVNDIFRTAVGELIKVGDVEESRNGPVRVYPSPVAVTYYRPWERLLFSRARRANPFFHLFEAFWMLAGRDDAAFLNRYVSDFGKRFAEEDGVLHGAYGRRWRGWFTHPTETFFDQIEWVIDLLLRDPQSRRAVITMYDPTTDSIKHGQHSPNDIPCNTQIYLRLKPGDRGAPRFAEETAETPDHPPPFIYPDGTDPLLELSVCCRSNDAIWGAYGANAVHFSVLQEYLAWRLDVRVGPMHQFSNNLHLYDSTAHLFDPREPRHDKYATDEVAASPLFYGAEAVTFHDELSRWLRDPSNLECESYSDYPFANLLIPMSQVHDRIKAKQWEDAMKHADNIWPTDWRAAARQWIETRARKKIDG